MILREDLCSQQNLSKIQQKFFMIYSESVQDLSRSLGKSFAWDPLSGGQDLQDFPARTLLSREKPFASFHDSQNRFLRKTFKQLLGEAPDQQELCMLWAQDPVALCIWDLRFLWESSYPLKRSQHSLYKISVSHEILRGCLLIAPRRIKISWRVLHGILCDFFSKILLEDLCESSIWDALVMRSDVSIRDPKMIVLAAFFASWLSFCATQIVSRFVKCDVSFVPTWNAVPKATAWQQLRKPSTSCGSKKNHETTR